MRMAGLGATSTASLFVRSRLKRKVRPRGPSWDHHYRMDSLYYQRLRLEGSCSTTNLSSMICFDLALHSHEYKGKDTMGIVYVHVRVRVCIRISVFVHCVVDFGIMYLSWTTNVCIWKPFYR